MEDVDASEFHDAFYGDFSGLTFDGCVPLDQGDDKENRSKVTEN